jgi:hypothetical protein
METRTGVCDCYLGGSPDFERNRFCQQLDWRSCFAFGCFRRTGCFPIGPSESEAGAEAMAHDGVLADTMVILVEA